MRRLRLGIAAVVVLASLLAASAWWKSATCGCGSNGLPWETIAVAATLCAGVAIAAYVFITAVTSQASD
jgi:hypothetical protein